jgi:hypothetical protein
MRRATQPMTVGSAIAGPTLAGTEDEALLQALRNLWPILDTKGRKQAVKTVKSIKSAR